MLSPNIIIEKKSEFETFKEHTIKINPNFIITDIEDLFDIEIFEIRTLWNNSDKIIEKMQAKTTL